MKDMQRTCWDLVVATDTETGLAQSLQERRHPLTVPSGSVLRYDFDSKVDVDRLQPVAD